MSSKKSANQLNNIFVVYICVEQNMLEGTQIPKEFYSCFKGLSSRENVKKLLHSRIFKWISLIFLFIRVFQDRTLMYILKQIKKVDFL